MKCRPDSAAPHIDHWDVTPDIMCFGKALGGGVRSTFSTPEIWTCLEPNPFTTTTGGNPLACSAALAAITVLIKKDYLAGQAKTKGEYVLKQLGVLKARWACGQGTGT